MLKHFLIFMTIITFSCSKDKKEAQQSNSRETNTGNNNTLTGPLIPFFTYCTDCEKGENVGSCTPAIKHTIDALKANLACSKLRDRLQKSSNLTLKNAEISDVLPLAEFTNLKELDLSGNQISDVNPLAGLTNLVSLNLYQNQISNLSPLAKLINLNYLNLIKNQISDTNPLAKLKKLLQLDLGENQISNADPLAGLINWHLGPNL
ncbi:MAG: leucine-rich repeat domain-containing protein [Oligoflexales bacterium]